MFIELHGFPGSGKSTVLTMIAQKLVCGKSVFDLKPHKYVYTSFPCPNCYKIDPKEIGTIDISDATVIIDEISEFFDNRQYKEFKKETMMYMKLSRHYNVDFVIASQSSSDADKKIRTLVQKSYIIESYGCFSAIKPIEKWHSVVNGEPSEKYALAKFSKWLWCYRPRWYKYFDSYETKSLENFIPEFWECDFKEPETLKNKILSRLCTKKRVENEIMMIEQKEETKENEECAT